ncbi:very-long-chain 3-oxoacyl-CoA reductase-like [Artemia franciscana]|uniref:Uncharacterized protein n=1 Tax=Artemia franciscana TaxID=6661 RepID=A0AA88L837_ARTSF|nr:hypothetical protein QYM36_012682 [Artemia franciscana]KAK2711614.1 hypothetical protein QYM36_012682 [Artemia franciscana]KAK2711615.1 hypothetical protein QYM36_012682 [Artemia franciscana]
MGFVESTGFVLFVFFALRLAWAFLKFLRVTLLPEFFGFAVDLKRYGEWAVVTGSTDGIGKAFAQELAKNGMNIVLISRSMDKLENVAREIRDTFNVKTKVISADYTRTDIYDRIGNELQGLDIGILINNVGMSYAYPEFVWKVDNPMEFSERLVNCNITSVTHMTLLVLPKMVEKRNGLILNISSASANFPTPFLSVYASSKAFVVKYSRDLAAECAPYGVKIQCVLPGFVATKLANISKTSFGIPDPTQYVQGAIKSLGLETASYGYVVHRIVYSLFEFGMFIGAPIAERISWYAFYAVRAKNLHKMKMHKDAAEDLAHDAIKKD